MTLARRTRAVARAGQGHEYIRLAIAIFGVGLLATGLTGTSIIAEVAGAGVVGWVLGTISTNADRRYLEGFSDGLAIGPELEAPGRPGPVRGSRDAADLGGLPAGPRPDVDDRADEPRDGALGSPRGGVAASPGSGSYGSAFGLPPGNRSAASPLAPDGSPAVVSGPRRSSFPDIPGAPAAVGGRSPRPLQIARPPYRSKARRRRGTPGPS